MHNYYPFAPDKLGIKRVMLSDYQLKVAGDYNISIGNIKKLVRNSFNEGKCVLH